LGLAGFLGGSKWLSSRTVSAADVVGTAAQRTATAAATGPYQAIGVRPLINARGTFTILGGNIELPEVQAAKTLANQQHAHLDELAAAAGKRLAELTGAEWGMVSAGCAAAMSHATAACLAGGNPEMHVRIPDLRGFPKDEVIIPTSSRNQYDAAIRALGVKIVEVDSIDSLRLALGPRTAMIYLMADNSTETGPMSTAAICAIARTHNVPVLVDAAAEVLTVQPNVHLARGATLVCYSGGKAIRGPQSAGILLGRKDLCEAAWVHSAPHHGYSRNMKVGREEIVAMVVAVDIWVKRDHAAVSKDWIARLELIANRVNKIPGVVTTVRPEQESRNNRASNLTIRWESQKLGITGTEVARILDTTEPRIVVAGSTGVGGGGGRGGGGRGGGQGRGQAGGAQGGPAQPPLAGDTSLSINPHTLAPGDDKIIADQLFQILSAPRTLKPAEPVAEPATDVSGAWQVEIQFVAGRSTHGFQLLQNGSRLTGNHQGDFATRDINGTINGDTVTLSSNLAARGDTAPFRFTGKVAGDTIAGTLDLGEYLGATFTARRRGAGRG
jgi:L-seryl-tRNA(Ser) seleniumtransferase